MIKEYIQEAARKWKMAWDNHIFRKMTITGFLSLFIIIGCFPLFFHYIEMRPGYLLNDWILIKIPAYNISALLFTIIWIMVLMALVTGFRNPKFMLTLLIAYCLLCLCRYISISFVPLDTPLGLIPLVDPFTNVVYGNRFITKDLFFSGHTSTLFLIFFCLENKKSRNFALLAAMITAILLLIQHVHYTIDIIAAPFFAWICYRIAMKLTVPAKKEID